MYSITFLAVWECRSALHELIARGTCVLDLFRLPQSPPMGGVIKKSRQGFGGLDTVVMIINIKKISLGVVHGKII